MSDRQHRNLVIQRYQWQTKGFFTAQKVRARYYTPTPRKGVSNMANEESITDAQARESAREYGASPDEIEREIARDYRGATWYWSPEQRALVSVYDGQTTVQELGDALARGPLDERQEAMAADFWVMAAQQVNTAASAAQNAASVRADAAGTTQSLAAFLAADHAAGVAGEILTELSDRAAELNRVADSVRDERIAAFIEHSTATKPDEAAREASREAQADASSRELGELFDTPKEESPGKAGAAEAVTAAHEAVQANTQLAAEKLDAQAARTHADGQTQLAKAADQAPVMEASA